MNVEISFDLGVFESLSFELSVECERRGLSFLIGGHDINRVWFGDEEITERKELVEFLTKRIRSKTFDEAITDAAYSKCRESGIEIS